MKFLEKITEKKQHKINFFRDLMWVILFSKPELDFLYYFQILGKRGKTCFLLLFSFLVGSSLSKFFNKKIFGAANLAEEKLIVLNTLDNPHRDVSDVQASMNEDSRADDWKESLNLRNEASAILNWIFTTKQGSIHRLRSYRPNVSALPEKIWKKHTMLESIQRWISDSIIEKQGFSYVCVQLVENKSRETMIEEGFLYPCYVQFCEQNGYDGSFVVLSSKFSDRFVMICETFGLPVEKSRSNKATIMRHVQVNPKILINNKTD